MPDMPAARPVALIGAPTDIGAGHLGKSFFRVQGLLRFAPS